MKKLIICLLLLAPALALAQRERKVVFLEDKDLYQVVYYHENGSISQQGTLNIQGQLHGQWESFAENGEKIALGNYVNGKKDGKWFFWTNDGLSEVDYNLNGIASVQQWKEGSKVALNQ